MHIKSWKNHKIENKDVLESLWLDLCNESIIWHGLVEKYCPRILFMLVRDKIYIYSYIAPFAMKIFMVGCSCDAYAVAKVLDLFGACIHELMI